MSNSSNNKNKKDHKNKNNLPDIPLYNDSIDAIPSNEYDVEDDSLLSSLHLDAVPVDSELVSSEEAELESDEKVYDNEQLFTSQYLDLPEEFNKKLEKIKLNVEEEEGEEEEKCRQDTIVCPPEEDDVYEDSIAEIESLPQDAKDAKNPISTNKKNAAASSIFPYLKNQKNQKNIAKEIAKAMESAIEESDSSLLEAAALDESQLDMITDEGIIEESSYFDATIAEDAFEESGIIPDDIDMPSQYIAEAIGEDTFLEATIDRGLHHFSGASKQNMPTQDISVGKIPIANAESSATKDFDFEPQDSSSQNMPTQDMPMGHVSATDNITSTNQYVGNLPFSSPFQKGDVVDNRYKVTGFLGQGGMAHVYKVEHLLLPGNKNFALKVLSSFNDKQRELSKRFSREVGVMMEFSHPNVIAIRDFGITPQKKPYFTMDYCTGTPIKTIIAEKGPLDIKLALEITCQILNALEEAHKKHIIHRDLKPENLMLEMRDGKPHIYVLDFGIAKNLNVEYTEKLTQGIIGTLLYMSPEQATAQNLTISTDIYSLGATLYHMIAGRPPFKGTKQEIVIKIVQENALPPSYVRKGIPKEIDDLILKALAKKTDERYESAAEFRQAIEKILANNMLDKVSKVSNVASSQAFTPGDIVNSKYKIVDVLGSGGMGIVYKVEHLELSSTKRFFALKLLDPQLSKDTSFKDRFYREIEMAMEFTHENVIQIRDFGHTREGHYYYTMDYSRGQTLTNVICKNGQLPISRALNIAHQVLSALKNPHKKNIAHRDLKPDNIIIEDRNGEDHALVLDFGIAKILDNNAQKITQEGSLGTPYYMSPEQASAENLDVKTDFYSLGVILFEMITGKVPFSGSTKEVLVAHVIKKPPMITDFVKNIPLAVEELIVKSLQKDRSARFASADEFISAIDNIAQRERKLISRQKWRRVIRALASCLILAGFSSIAFLYLYVDQKNRELEQLFLASLDNSDKEKTQFYKKELQEQFFAVNTFVFPDKLKQIDLQLKYYQHLDEYNIAAAEKVLSEIQLLRCSTPEVLISLQDKMNLMYHKQYFFGKVIKKINANQVEDALKMLTSSSFQDKNTQTLIVLSKMYIQLQKLAKEDVPQAKITISKDILPILQELSFFNFREFELEVRRIEESLAENKNITAKTDNPKVVLSELEDALNKGKIDLAEHLLNQIKNYPQNVITYEQKQKYENMYAIEKEYSYIKSENDVKRYQLFLEKYPKTQHKNEIEQIIAQNLKTQYSQAVKYYNDKKYSESLKKLEEIHEDPNYSKIRDDKDVDVLLYLVKIYYKNKTWSKITAFENEVKFITSNSKDEVSIYIAIAWNNLANNKKAYDVLKQQYNNFLSLSSTTTEAKQEAYAHYKQAFNILLQNLKSDKSIDKKQRFTKYIKLLDKGFSLFEEIEYAKLLARSLYSSDKKRAKIYLDKYITSIQKSSEGKIAKLKKQDQGMVDAWFALQNYYPLNDNNQWTYKSTVYEGETRSKIFTEKITKDTFTNKYTFVNQDDEQTKDVYTAKGFYVFVTAFKQESRIIPVKLRCTASWARPLYNGKEEQVKMIGFSIPVTCEIGVSEKTFMCIQLETFDRQNNMRTYEYYAPNIGLVKQERFKGEEKTFEQVLEKYKLEIK